MSKFFVGVDVGTSSARAALVSAAGEVIKQCVKAFTTWNPEPSFYQQSSEQIWQSVCYCVQDVTKGVSKKDIVSISYDATCSLVVLGKNGTALPVSRQGSNPEQNIILWMDHRANKEAEKINATKHKILEFVGGQVSVEMEIPKLLWLKQHASKTCYEKLWRAFDLPDFLTWRSTDADTRSLCSVVCKWNYDAMNNTWCKDYLMELGLEELCDNDFEIIGKKVLEPGQPVGNGLTVRAAKELNLLPGTKVGTSLIDAHAGALGMFGCRTSCASSIDEKLRDVQTKMALICGTSTCHMSVTREPCWAKGIWGPYRGAVLPGYYLNEGGQSASGFLLEFILHSHPQYKILKTRLKAELDDAVYYYLNDLLYKMAKERKLEDVGLLTKNIHVYPDFHGNRSPVADPTLRGMISGLSMNADDKTLAILYLTFMQALGYGTRHIIERLYEHKRSPLAVLLFCGGLAKNLLYVKCHADICQLPALVPKEQEMVLVGSAMLGACAASAFGSLEEAANKMGGEGELLQHETKVADFHERKYKIFLEMLNNQRKYKEIMETNVEDCV